MSSEPVFLVKPEKRKMIRCRILPQEKRDNFFEIKCKVIEDALEKLFKKQYDDVSFVNLYEISYSMVFNGHGEKLYEKLDEILKKHLEKMREDVVNASENEFLSVIATTYNKYRTVLTVLSTGMWYVDEMFAGNPEKKKKKLFAHGLDLFNKEIVTDKIFTTLRKEIVTSIVNKRGGEEVDSFHVRNACIMLNDLESYGSVVEEPLLDVTKEYYSKVSGELMENHSVEEYIQKVHDIVVSEHSLVENYLIPVSSQKIDDCVRDVMVTKHMKFVLEDTESGFLTLLKEGKTKSLYNVYFLFKHNTEHLETIRNKFKEYVFNHGRVFVTDGQNLEKPLEFIQEVVKMKGGYDELWEKSFDKDAKFLEALNEGFSGFADGTIQKRMAELLSLYVDLVMKKNYEKKHLETALSIFRYLKDKDVFENYYKIHLSKRLLVSRMPNEEAEKTFLTMLRDECGYAFTSKIQGMFNDIRLSKISMERFEKHKARAQMKEKLTGVELHVSILTSSFWPSYTFSPCNLPSDLNTCKDFFGKYYKDVHSGRKLTWQNNLGDGVMVARYPVSKHEIILTTFQMVLLLLFNKSNKLTFEEVKEKTQMQERDIKRNLLMLCLGKFKLLSKEPKSKTVREGDVFSWNADFRSGNVRIRVGNIQVVRGSLGRKNDELEKDLVNPNSKRDVLIEKALIKVLKKKKSISHKDLAMACLDLLKGKLEPKPNGIELKKRIESLIHREFIKRNEEDRKFYDYIA